jgi:GNAT superfamily N-acetyltransferase
MPATAEKTASVVQAVIRAATQDDAATILGFIRELAEYEKLSHEVVATEADLTRTLFGPQPYAECLIAELDGAPVGFALFFHNFSTFLGKPGLYVEDVYVSPAARGSGTGMNLFRALAKIALERDCGRMEWWVLDWNKPAIDFYEKMGATPMSEWTVQRLTGKEIKKLAEF